MDTGLQLADNTNTEVQEQEQKKPVSVKFNFQHGNYDLFTSVPKIITEVRQTILPIFTAALIELLGDDTSIKFDTFNSSFVTKGDKVNVIIDITIKTVKWVKSDVSKEAVNQDAQYVLNQLKVVPNVTWQNCSINTNDGSLNLRFVI